MTTKLINFLTFEEVNKLVRAAKTKQLKLAIALGAGSGLRISEVVGQKTRYTKCCKVKVEDKIIKVDNKPRKKKFCSKCGKMLDYEKDTFESKKKDDWNIPPVIPDVMNLDEHQIRIIQGKGKKDRITVTSKWLNETNIKILPIKMPQRTLQWQFNRLTERVLKQRHNFHMLRHSFGNFMVVEKNVPMTVVQQLMGHSRLDTTAIYSKANPKQAIKIAWEAF